MAPILTVVLKKILEYIGSHSNEIVDAFDKALIDIKDREITNAIRDLGFDATEQNLNNLYKLVGERGEESHKEELVNVILNKIEI